MKIRPRQRFAVAGGYSSQFNHYPAKEPEKESLMYSSTFLTKTERTKTLIRLYDMGFNLIPMNRKRPCAKWKRYQTERVKPNELREWMRGAFPTKDSDSIWKANLLNFAIVTGAIPWSTENPGIVVVEADDEEAEKLIKKRCPETPMMQISGTGWLHRVYRHPQGIYIPNRQKIWVDGKKYNADVRGDGGDILCPGSIHPETGNSYREVQPWTLELLQQCPVYDPAWIPDERATGTSISKTTDLREGTHDDLISDIDIPIAEREEIARHYLKSVPGTKQGTGADRRCSALSMRLLYGFALPANSVQRLLDEWGQREDQLDLDGAWYPWTGDEIRRKVAWCCSQEYEGRIGDRLCFDGEDDLEAIKRVIKSFPVDQVIDPKDQLEIAKRFLQDCFTFDKCGTLIHHQGMWYNWTGKRYESISDHDIKAKLWKWLAKCQVKKKGKCVKLRPTRALVSGVFDALKAVANKPSTLEAPCWLNAGPSQIIAFANGLLDVDEFLQTSQTILVPHTPNWFSANCLPHDFDPKSSCPQWIDFLADVFDGDEARISALQQWFGYNLISDNRHHKMALLIGPPRSGKGTTFAVMSAMLGKHNIASTSLAALGGRFGLEPLVGKLSAIIDEGHLGKFSDSSLILERLKAISGGSEQTVDRKGVAALSSVSLKVRFTLAVNELPRLSDSSAALRSRLLVIPYFNTYEGKEDVGLVDRLLTEIPGITNWRWQD